VPDAPDRIWLRHDGDALGWRDVGVADPEGLAAVDPEVVEYVRADEVERLKELVRRLAAIAPEGVDDLAVVEAADVD
jgi:hypothetical protein